MSLKSSKWNFLMLKDNKEFEPRKYLRSVLGPSARDTVEVITLSLKLN